MSRYLNRKSITGVFIALALAIGLLGGTLQHVSAAPAHSASPKVVKSATSVNPFCSRLGASIQASSGAWMYCKGPQAGSSHSTPTTNPSFGSNVDAANPREDVTPSGVQVYGQSEVSIASIGPYVVEAWNDATGFFYPGCTPAYKEELTGYGFSANGGKSFTDEGGLPDSQCAAGYKYYGDPSVETWKTGGTTYFYISSLFLNGTTGDSYIAMDACTVGGSSIACRGPYYIAHGGPGDFLDKDFLTIDPNRGRLYNSYTRFGPPTNAATTNGQIELALCNIASHPAAPTCYPGASPTPYLVVQPGDVSCENEGAYPAADVKTGNVYVAWEFNWATNYMNCTAVPTTQRVAYVPFSCLTLTPVSPCATAPKRVAVPIHSIDLAFIPGFNRNPSTAAPANDFPRIAVSDKYGTVSITWNDTRLHPLGDIFLQSFKLVSLSKVQSSPARINPDATGGLHFMPALRNSDDEGYLNISYFQRQDEDTALTNVDLVMNISPLTTGPGSATVVTTGPSNWLAVSSDIQPNFGDYTDNYIHATSSAPYVDDTLYVAWSDGRLGLPQPFEAHGFS